jgi:CDP-4-dehydro-6-deoxyglucose reductase, E1
VEQREKDLRKAIADLVKEYYLFRFQEKEFVGGKTPVHYAGRVFNERELQVLVDSSLDFWLTSGRYSEAFESEFASFVGVEYALLVNSGSSANLVALSALTSPLLEERRLRPGDEVITVAAGFPTTVNPILQNGMIPVFVDIDIGAYNINTALLEKAIGPKTRALFLAHTLGNPYDLDKIVKLANDHKLWLVEDCCDALGSQYRGRMVGTFGQIATCSFYPAHHMTMGEGGCVFTNDDTLFRIARSMRDWGRDCYCASGENNTCGKRFNAHYGSLPKGYDHKYVYSHIGYNLKPTDMQAAIGVEQLKKLPEFISRRKENFGFWTEKLKDLNACFILPEPTEGADPAWFAFPITVKSESGFTRTELTDYLSEHLVETRNLFGGNLLRQPAYQHIVHRVSGSLDVTDVVMNQTFFLGTYPGLTLAQIDYVVFLIKEFVNKRNT